MAGCNHHHNQSTFDGMSDAYKRRLWMVIFLNAGMFVVEIFGGAFANSKALQADALDFLGDATTYGLSLYVIGMSITARTRAAMLKGISLFVMGLWVFGSTAYSFWTDTLPVAELMGGIGFMALAANLLSVFLLVNFKDGDANVRSVWLCSRNDAIGNVAVMLAAVAVWFLGSRWPDLIVAIMMAGLFLSSAWQILTQALREKKELTA
ncbi:cation diffusion facilitator family transporter [Ahrensia kielensis]|uniref:Cation diffusion facilitator family transporter n=1 Tax=Ahrensia kielensis TaxID=76980 RepID=A0ABU9T5D0_9HYPH|nr:cation diffusion facilitator family transporter [Ahrensia sp. 13_GOM-1096m]